MVNVKTFLNSGAKPNLSEVDLALLDYRTISSISQMTESEVVSKSFAIICDDPVWVVSSENENGAVTYYSHDGGDGIYLATGKRTGFVKFALIDGRLNMQNNTKIVFAPKQATQSENKEEKIMVNELDAVMNEAQSEVSGNKQNTETSALQGIMEKAESEVAGEVKQMTSFGDQDKPAKRAAVDPEVKQQRDAAREEIEKMRRKVRDDVRALSSGQTADMQILSAAWKKVASLLCFIPPSDKRHSISAAKVPLAAADRVLLDNAPDDVKAAQRQNPAAVDSKWYKASYEIKARESKPGATVGAVVRMPAFLKGCTASDFISDVVAINAKKALEAGDVATVDEVLTFPDFLAKLALVGGSIMEAPEIAPEHGKPGEICFKLENPNSKAVSSRKTLKDKEVVLAKKLLRTGQGNQQPLHDRNYFPLVTYETFDISKPMPDDVVSALNTGMFTNLFSTSSNSKQVGTKYSNLVEAASAHIKKEGDVITSDYITNDATKRLDMTISAFFDKNLVRPSINLPLKRPAKKSDGSLGSLQFVKYDCRQEEKMADPDYRGKSALGLPQFQHIVKLVGEELLSPENLKATFKRSGGALSHKYLQADITANLIRGVVSGDLSQYAINGLDLGM